TAEKKGMITSGTTMPIVFVAPDFIARASWFGRYPSSEAAWSTFSRVAALADPLRASTRAAADFDTPAFRATSMIVTVSRAIRSSPGVRRIVANGAIPYDGWITVREKSSHDIDIVPNVRESMENVN